MVWLELDLIPRNMCEQAIEVDSHANGRFESDSICTNENISMTFDSHERAYIVRHMHIVSACNCGCETIWHYTAIGICDGGLPVSGAPTRSPCIMFIPNILKMPRSIPWFVYKWPNRAISIETRKMFHLINVGAAKWCGFLVYFFGIYFSLKSGISFEFVNPFLHRTSQNVVRMRPLVTMEQPLENRFVRSIQATKYKINRKHDRRLREGRMRVSDLPTKRYIK